MRGREGRRRGRVERRGKEACFSVCFFTGGSGGGRRDRRGLGTKRSFPLRGGGGRGGKGGGEGRGRGGGRGSLSC